MASFLEDFMRELAAETVRHPLLDRLAQGPCDSRLWAIYLRERFRTVDVDAEGPSLFENFLEAALACSRRLGLGALERAFKRNLDEERGFDLEGGWNASEVHATWRQNFKQQLRHLLQARGVGSDFFEGPARAETVAYTQVIHGFMDQLSEDKIFEAAGAFCALELIIRSEYAKIASGLDRDFPELSPSDRRYIDDHVVHDEFHYLWIRTALDQILEKLPENERASCLALIQKGALQISQAKQDFFEGVRRD